MKWILLVLLLILSAGCRAAHSQLDLELSGKPIDIQNSNVTIRVSSTF